MATRNFIQQGLAFGSTTASVTVTLDGVEIYSGPVPTVDQPLPPGPGPDIEDTAYTWTLPADFVGSKTLTVQVSGSPFLLAGTLADRTELANTARFDPLNHFQEISGQTVSDPFSNVVIDGTPMSRDPTLGGQWYWVVQPGQTLTATLNIPAGINYPDWDPLQSYPPVSNVVYQSVCYNNGISTASPGVVPSENPEIWFTIPIPVWDINGTYTIWSRVKNSENMIYMAIQNVPAGTDLLNTSYWEYRGTPS